MPSIRPPRPADHVVLLGDSIFANAAYTRGEPDVTSHLRSLLPGGWQATLIARDGATTADLPSQLRQLPGDATRLVIAIGGNDAIGNIDLLSFPASSSAQVLDLFATRVAAFEADYRDAIGAAVGVGPPVTICTIYNGALAPDEARRARIALMMFNDVILRTAVDARLNVLELRAICRSAEDYANPIEPSGEGGRKIARAIAGALGLVANLPAPSRVWGDGGSVAVSL